MNSVDSTGRRGQTIREFAGISGANIKVHIVASLLLIRFS